MRRMVTMLAVGALLLALSASIALAVNQSGTSGDDTLTGNNRADRLSGEGGNDLVVSCARERARSGSAA